MKDISVKYSIFDIEKNKGLMYQIRSDNYQNDIMSIIYDKIDSLVIKNMPDEVLVRLILKLNLELERRGLKI